MDDLDSRLSKLLEDDSLQDKISELISSLGSEGDESRQAFTKSDSDRESPDLGDLLKNIDLGEITGLLGSLGPLSQGGDDGGRLLSALSPYLRPSRQKKLKDAKLLLSLYKLLPLVNSLRDKE